MSCGGVGRQTHLTTKHLRPKTCFPTSVTPAYSHYRLHIGYPPRAFCSVTKLRQKAHKKATSPLPPQPRVHLVLFVHCPGGIYLLTAAFILSDFWDEGNTQDCHLPPICHSHLPSQSQLKATLTGQTNQLKILKALWLGMPGLPQLSPMGLTDMTDVGSGQT